MAWLLQTIHHPVNLTTTTTTTPPPPNETKGSILSGLQRSSQVLGLRGKW